MVFASLLGKPEVRYVPLQYRYNTVTFRYRIRQRGLHGKTDTNAKEPVSSVAKDGRAEEKRGYEC